MNALDWFLIVSAAGFWLAVIAFVVFMLRTPPWLGERSTLNAQRPTLNAEPTRPQRRPIEDLDTLTLETLLSDMEALQAENDALRDWCTKTNAAVSEVRRRMDAGKWDGGAA